MASVPPLPSAGYALRRIYTVSQSYEIHETDKVPEGSDNDRDISFNWDWRLLDDGCFQVVVAIGIRGRQPQPEEARVVVIGEFQVSEAGEPADLPLRDFVTGNAPAILFPYARQVIANLTGGGPFGMFHLPPVNVRRLMKDESYEDSTGAQQLPEVSAGAEDALPGSDDEA